MRFGYTALSIHSQPPRCNSHFSASQIAAIERVSSDLRGVVKRVIAPLGCPSDIPHSLCSSCFGCNWKMLVSLADAVIALSPWLLRFWTLDFQLWAFAAATFQHFSLARDFTPAVVYRYFSNARFIFQLAHVFRSGSVCFAWLRSRTLLPF